MGQGNDKAK